MRRKCEGFSVDVTLLVLSMLQNNFILRSYSHGAKLYCRNQKTDNLNQGVFILMFHCDATRSILLYFRDEHNRNVLTLRWECEDKLYIILGCRMQGIDNMQLIGC